MSNIIKFREKTQSVELMKALEKEKKIFCLVLLQKIIICRLETCHHFNHCHPTNDKKQLQEESYAGSKPANILLPALQSTNKINKR